MPRILPARPLDRVKVIAYLKAKAEHKNLLIHAVLAGMLTAVERGDFDIEVE